MQKKASELIKKIQQVKNIKKTLAVIGTLIPIIKIFIIMVAVAFSVFIPIIFFNNIKDGFYKAIDKTLTFLTTGRWMSAENAYYQKLEDEYDIFLHYKNREGEFDIPLLAATSHYVNVVGANSFEYAEDEDEFHEDYSDEGVGTEGDVEVEHFVENKNTRRFYTIARNELGTSASIIPGTKKLIGHLVDVRVETECRNLSEFFIEDDEEEESIYALIGHLWYDFLLLTAETIGDTSTSFLSIVNIPGWLNLIDSYKEQDINYLAHKLEEFFGSIPDENIFVELARIIKQSSFEKCSGAQIAVPKIVRFVNYERYRQYLEEDYLPKFYINCKNCPDRDKSDEDKKIIAENMAKDIFNQKDVWDYITGDVSDEISSISGGATLPIKFAAGEDWKKHITSYFGNRTHPVTGEEDVPHIGIDIGAPIGTPVYTIASGRVVNAGWQGSYGKFVLIAHDPDGDGVPDYYSGYAHLSVIDVSLGQEVIIGEKIGEVGITGVGTGPHLHFEIRDRENKHINPFPILNRIVESGYNPLQGDVGCGLENPEKIEQLNKILKNKINSFLNKSEPGNAVAAAAEFAVRSSGINLQYWWGGKSKAIGIDKNWGCPMEIFASGYSAQPKYESFPYGVDCSGLVQWAIHNAGYKWETIPEGAGAQSRMVSAQNKVKINGTTLNQVQPGDLVWREGHIAVIIGKDVNSSKFIVAAARDADRGTDVVEYFINSTSFTHFVFMSEYYNNPVNKE